MLSTKQLTAGLNELPPLPAAVVDILEALKQKDVATELLKDKIMQDPGLSSKVLSVANSPFYGMSGNIVSIKEACMVLGLHTLKNIAVAAGMLGKFPPDSGNHIGVGELWRHAVGTGVAARVLSLKCKIDPELAFTAGLLHDFGKMVLDQCFPDEYEQVLMTCKADDSLLHEAECKVLGIDHGEVGAMVARRWHLPETIVDVLQNHHNADASNRDKLTDLISVADIISRGLGIGNPGDDLIPALEAGTMDRLGLDIADIIEHLPEIDKLNSLSESLISS